MNNIARGVILFGFQIFFVSAAFADMMPPLKPVVAKKSVKVQPGPTHATAADARTLKKVRKDEKTILCDDAKVQKVHVNFGRITILSFPVAPKEILPGEAVFDFRQIKGDLAIKALKPSARTNIAVYLSERRCSFDLVTVPYGGDDILFVRDPIDRQFEVKFQ